MKLTSHTLLKSLDCDKFTWLSYRHPEYKNKANDEYQLPFEKIREIKQIGKTLFTGGIDLSRGNTLGIKELTEVTKRAFLTEHGIFYNPTFQSNDLVYQADVLIKSKKRTKILNIVDGIYIKIPDHIIEAAFLMSILKSNKWDKLTEIHCAFLNRNYVRNGRLNIDELFVTSNLTYKSKYAQAFLDRKLYKLNYIVNEKSSPPKKIGEWCQKPNPCEFIEHCWAHLPKSSKTIGFNTRIEKSDSDEVEEFQSKEVYSYSINKKVIKKYIDSLNLSGPIYFLNLGTFTPAIPQFTSSTCYQEIFFQSCILFRHQNLNYERKEFFAEPGYDPRGAFIEHFINSTKEKGNLLIFEAEKCIKRLNELIDLFPEYSEEINERISRIKDLQIPFTKKFVYSKTFKEANFSLEVIFEVLCPNENFRIEDDRILKYKYEMYDKLWVEEQINLIKEIKENCYNRIVAMTKIVEVLQRI